MGRKKLEMKKIENSTARQVTYSKRKDGMMKKANELGILCGIDVALIMFSPSGRLTTFASSGRVEDVFLRLMDRPNEVRRGLPVSSDELLVQKLKRLKFEAEMLEKIAKIEALEENLDKLNQRQREANEKMKYYEPDVEQINSVLEAEVYEKFLERAMHRTQLAKAKLLGKEVDVQNLKNPEIHNSQVAAIVREGESSTANRSVHKAQKRSILAEETHEVTDLPTGPHPSLSFRRAKKEWHISRCQKVPRRRNP